MAYAQAKIASTIQDKLTGVLENLAKLTVDLAQPDLKSEERAQVIKEIQEAKEGLNFNTKSAVSILHAEPKRLYDNYRVPECNQVEATEEFEKARRDKFAEMTGYHQRKTEGKLTKEDQTRKDIVPAEFYLYQSDATVRVGLVQYKKSVDGVCDQSRPLLYSGEITASLYEAEIIEDPLTGTVSLHSSLCNFLKKAEKIGLDREMFDRMLLLFVKNKLPGSYGSVRRLEGKALFEAVLALSSYNTMVNDLTRRIETIVREVGAGPEPALYEVKSVASEIIRISIPNITESQLQRKLETIINRLIPKLITDKAKVEYMAFLKNLRVSLGVEASLEQRLEFINEIESDPSYSPTEPIRVRKTDIPASLFHSKVFLGVDPEAESGASRPFPEDYYEPREEIMEGIFLTEGGTSTRSQQRPLGPPLHPMGDQPGVGDASLRGGRRQFIPGAYSSASSSSAGPVTTSVHRALIHTGPGGSSVTSGQTGEEKYGLTDATSAALSTGFRRNGEEPPDLNGSRGRDPTKKKIFRPLSPGSGHRRLYRQGSNGSMRSVSRDRIFHYDKRKGFTPRSFTRSPSRFYETLASVPADRCAKCYRYVGGETGQSCTPARCLRYLDTPLNKQNCSVCRGGFHMEQFCSKKNPAFSGSRSQSRNRTGTPSPGRGLNTSFKKN